MKLLFQSIKFILLPLLILGTEIQYPALVKAQIKMPALSKQSATPVSKPVSPQINNSRPIFRWTKPPGRLSTISGRSLGMGSRDFCPEVQKPLRALVPFKEREAGKPNNELISATPMDVWGLTTVEHPTFWFYVPYTKNINGASAEFVLQDGEENEVYRSAVLLPAKPGIINVTLPATTASLQVNKNYRWFFKVSCSGQQSVPVHVEGDIQRVNLNPSLEKELATAQPRDKIAIYANNGIWFEALTLLAQLRKANPNDTSLVSDWQSLLESIRMGSDYAQAPLVE